MPTQITLKREIFNDIYLPYIYDHKKRYNLYIGGSGSGKSHFVFQKLILKALRHHRPRKILVIRKVARTLKDSVFQLTLDILSQWQLIGDCEVNRSNFTITLPGGSVMLFKGLDDSEKIKSIVGITDIIIEEASEVTLEDFQQLDLRLRAREQYLSVYMMTNPISKVNWVYKYFFENGTPQNTFILHSTYKHNKFLPPEYVQTLEDMINTNPTWYKIYALGEFVSLGKMVYTNWERGFVPEDKSNLQILVGLDFGYSNDPSAIIVSYADVINKVIYIDREVYEKGLLNNMIYERIVNLGVAKETIYADAAEPKSIEELKRLGLARIIAAAKGPGSVNAGIQKLQQFKLIVNPSCSSVIEELENYAYKKDKSTQEYLNEPEDMFNHAMDALRYSIQKLNLNNKLGTMSKSALGL